MANWFQQSWPDNSTEKGNKIKQMVVEQLT